MAFGRHQQNCFVAFEAAAVVAFEAAVAVAFEAAVVVVFEAVAVVVFEAAVVVAFEAAAVVASVDPDEPVAGWRLGPAFFFSVEVLAVGRPGGCLDYFDLCWVCLAFAEDNLDCCCCYCWCAAGRPERLDVKELHCCHLRAGCYYAAGYSAEALALEQLSSVGWLDRKLLDCC